VTVTPEESRQQQALGRTRGGLSCKISVLADALGNPLDIHVTPGQACDLEASDAFLPAIVHNESIGAVLADKGYDADARLVTPLLAAGKQVVIPPRSHRKTPRDYDAHLYKSRHLIENIFASLKRYRCLATRYDKTKRNFTGAIFLACFLIWLN
jgi:transposase